MKLSKIKDFISVGRLWNVAVALDSETVGGNKSDMIMLLCEANTSGSDFCLKKKCLKF